MKVAFRFRQLVLPATKLQTTGTPFRNVSSSSSTSSSRAAALAKAAEASATASERLAAGGAPIMGSSYRSRQDANKVDSNLRILSDHDDASVHLNLSSSQARRSRAARFGTSRHTTYASPLLSGSASAGKQSSRASEEQDEDEDLALAYASPTGTSTSSIYLPEYVAWAISQLIAAANDPKLLRVDHLKLAHLTDPQEHMAEAAHIPPKRSSLLHLATVSPHRYAAILAVLAEVRQRLSTPSLAHSELEAALPRWTPDTVLDFDCAAGEGLWAAAQVFREDDSDPRSSTTLQRYHGYDRRPNLLKSGKKVAQSSASNVSPADPAKPQREIKLKDEGEEIQVDGVTYYEQESEDVEEVEDEPNQPALEYFTGPTSAMASVEKTFQSVPLAKDLASAGQGGRSLALSAFALSLMTNDSNRFEAVQAMWDSGAQVIVIIDQATPRGFASVASARAQLIQLGKQTAGGAHVVAPCSHDKPCPLLHPFAISSSVASAVGARADTGNPAKSKDICGFTARYHTPTFLRRTKHSERGEENVGYSYVVVRRGDRPSLVAEAQRRVVLAGTGTDVEEQVAAMVEELVVEAGSTKTGVLDLLRAAKREGSERRTLQEVDADAAITAGEGAVRVDDAGKMSDEQAMDELLQLLPDAVKAEFEAGSNEQMTAEQLDSIMASLRASVAPSSAPPSQTPSSSTSSSDEHTITLSTPTPDSELAMRLESYGWPRLIKPPLKKGGHVTLDACCASGNIERFTISKASGKQAYQDARKSKWGDLFPHPPRSRSVVKALNPLFALELQNLPVDNLTLRAPSKLTNPSVALDDDLDLAELFPPTDTTDTAAASYRLISPNLITPTTKQRKRISINYNKKWNPSATTTTPKADGFKSSLDTPPTQRRSSRKKSRGDWDSELFT